MLQFIAMFYIVFTILIVLMYTFYSDLKEDPFDLFILMVVWPFIMIELIYNKFKRGVF